MKKLFLLVCLLPMFLMAQVGEKNFIDQNYIEVTGTSEMQVVPDMIYMQIILNEKDNKGKIQLSELERNMYSALKSIGIDISKDLSIKDMSSNLKQRLLSKNEVLLSKEYELIAHTGNMAGKVLVELEKMGISNVNIIRVDHSQIEKLRRDVKVEAIKAAKSKASVLANAINQNIGKALYIQEISNNYRLPMFANNVMMRANSDNTGNQEDTEISFEKISLSSSILCKFELK